MAKFKQIFIGLIFLLSFLFVFDKAEAAETNAYILKAPILIAPNSETVTAKVKPLITGLVKSDYDVLIYIDGVYNGKLANLTHKSGTANFAYKPFLNLSVGNHEAWAMAVDKNGNKSRVSNILRFKIELPMPAPTMYKPVVNAQSTKNKPFIVGLAKNNSIIKVFVDHKVVGEFKVENHQSGTANFAFKPQLDLTRGTHLIYTTATDLRGKESSWSNLIWFKVTKPAIILGVKEEKAKETENTISDNIIPPIKNTDASTTTSGLIDESKQNQNKISSNLVVFILFLLGIIVWIFWVNKELVKERKESQIQIAPQTAPAQKPPVPATGQQQPPKVITTPPPKNNQQQK